MNIKKFGRAYAEVLEILYNIPREFYERIPQRLICLFESNKQRGYHFEYDINKTLKEQNVSDFTIKIIGFLYKKYFDGLLEEEKEILKRG